YFDQFLQDWLAGRIVSDIDLRLRAEASGWPLAERAVYAAGVVSLGGPAPGLRELQELAARLTRDGAQHRHEAKSTGLEGELTVLLTAVGGRASGASGVSVEAASTGASVVGAAAAEAAARLESALQERAFALCVGRETASREGVTGSYRDARRAAEVRAACRLEGPVVRYGELGVYMLLYRLLGTEELDAYMKLYLVPLLAMEGKQQGALLSTLRTYFACNCNAKETAERMFVHYNTIGYRLERIRSELGFRLDDPETKLQLQLAIKAHEVTCAEAR